MDSRPKHDSVTLTNIELKPKDSALLINPRPAKLVTEPVPPPDIMKRLRAFIPEIAAANDLLMQGTAQETKKLDVDILKVPVDTDGSESTSSEERSDSDESDEESERGPRVMFDLSLFRDEHSSSVKKDGESELRQEVDAVPEAFREDEESLTSETAAKKPRVLIEEL